MFTTNTLSKEKYIKTAYNYECFHLLSILKVFYVSLKLLELFYGVVTPFQWTSCVSQFWIG